jgi:hypothetical protein
MLENVRPMSRLAEEWALIADALGLGIIAPFTLHLPSGAIVEADVLLQQFGFSKGMLLFTNSEQICEDRDEIVRAGYGFSVLSEPASPTDWDLESIIDVLRDWTWAGDADEAPAWLRKPPVWSKEIDAVLSVGRPLDDIGVRNWALEREAALAALEQLSAMEVAVLGGDVLAVTHDNVRHNDDNWYCDRASSELDADFVERSISKARNYITHYRATGGGSVLFAIVPKALRPAIAQE